jgi:hypothetical protein
MTKSSRSALRRMTEVTHGLYRVPGWAYVTDGTIAFDISETDYRAGGYTPVYEEIPPKEDYDAGQAKER